MAFFLRFYTLKIFSFFFASYTQFHLHTCYNIYRKLNRVNTRELNSHFTRLSRRLQKPSTLLSYTNMQEGKKNNSRIATKYLISNIWGIKYVFTLRQKKKSILYCLPMKISLKKVSILTY